ncbi:MAG: helix-turn-helix domain-containing protein [Bacillota bacterium]|nr:helix-turn-helix domain-containing protein [Bacillota bacterium]
MLRHWAYPYYPEFGIIGTKEDKIKIVSLLDDRGVFLVKGAVEQVAKDLVVSKYTIYNYLEEARVAKNNDLL